MRQYKMCPLMRFSLTACVFRSCFRIQHCFRFFLLLKTQKPEKNAYFWLFSVLYCLIQMSCCFSFFFLFNLCLFWSRFIYFNKTIQNMFVSNKIYAGLSWRSNFFSFVYILILLQIAGNQTHLILLLLQARMRDRLQTKLLRKRRMWEVTTIDHNS